MRDFRAQLAVDKAAMSGERVDLLKRAGGEMTPEDALKNNIQSGMEDDSIVDKDAWEKEQREAYRDYVAKGVITFKKGATDMDRNTKNLVMFAKMAIDQGCSPGLNKSVFIAGISARAAEIRKAGESAAQSFARAITADEIGKTLYRASKVAPGPEIEPNPHKSPQQAYATVWNHANNVPLRQACQAEERQYKVGKAA
jgi:hypothetical protein